MARCNPKRRYSRSAGHTSTFTAGKKITSQITMEEIMKTLKKTSEGGAGDLNKYLVKKKKTQVIAYFANLLKYYILFSSHRVFEAKKNGRIFNKDCLKDINNTFHSDYFL